VGGLSRRRVQTIVIALVLLVSTAASVLALGLVVDSTAPFDHAFAAQRGAHAVMAIDSSLATAAQLAATTRLPEVAAAAGPFAEVTVTPGQAGPNGGLPPMTLAGRAAAGGPVDDVTLQAGRWARRPGELVVASDPAPGRTIFLSLGSPITVTGVPGTPTLTVVGIASSVSSSAGGWVVPAEIARLRGPGTAPSAQMLYRFASAGTAAAVRADVAAVSGALPAGAVTGAQSYLTLKAQETSSIGAFVPFLVAFGVLGMVMSVLIVGNVVSGAVVAGYRRIGVLKSIGFTPGQVVAAYTGQVTVPAVAGCLGGVLFGNLLAVPLLARAAEAYGVGALTIPAWVDAAVPIAMCCLVAIAALLPAVRAGRLSAVQAIATGRAPRTGRGYAAHRLLGRLRLPRPVTVGLASSFARPARTAATLVAVLLGATAVTFAVGLSTSLNRVVNGLSRVQTEQVQVDPAMAGPQGPAAPPGSASGNAAPAHQQSAAGQRSTVLAAIRAQPGTLHYVAEADQQVSVAGLAEQVQATAFQGAAAWTGYPIISGRWYTGPGQADVPTGFLTATGKAVGDTVTITVGGRLIPVRIVGEVFYARDKGMAILTDWRTLASAEPGLAADQFDIGLRPGTSADAYTQALGTALGSSYFVSLNSKKSAVVTLMIGLIGTLTLLLAIVAGLGVLNTIVLHTRERVHDLGVFKAVGMTPRQTIAMVVCWVAGTGLVAGIIAVPAGMTLHRYVLPAMAHSAGLGLPASFLHVYHVWELAGLALAGVAIAVAGALLPAGWAAAIRTASALRTE
jgi:putative ABC transport system permease protein